VTGQSDDAVFGGYGNVAGVDAGIFLEFAFDVVA
jgi:hypothetical protein